MEIPVKKNETYMVDIIDQGYEGEGIAKIEGYTIFVPGVIKEEKCKIFSLFQTHTLVYFHSKNREKICLMMKGTSNHD